MLIFKFYFVKFLILNPIFSDQIMKQLEARIDKCWSLIFKKPMCKSHLLQFFL